MNNDKFNRTLSFNTKLKYFLASWLLIEFILLDAVYKFIIGLNNRNIIHFGEDFDTIQIIWGDSIALNGIRVIILCLFSVLFGITYAYLARKVRESDKAAISLANGILAVFGSVIIYLLYQWIGSLFSNTSFPFISILEEIARGLKSSTFISIAITVQFVSTAICTYVGLNYGQDLIEGLDDEDKGRLFGIKWYHYLWLWYSISVYVQAFLSLLYLTLHSLRVFLSDFNVGELLGGTSGENSSNSLQNLGVSLVFYYFIGVIIFYFIQTQREILSGKSELHIFLKIVVTVLVALIIPTLLLMYTIVGGS